MSMNRREFLQILAAASAAGFALDSRELLAAQGGPRVAGLYDLPRFGNVHFLHFTDCHAQLLPIYFREPNVNLGIGGAQGKAPHLVGEHLLKAFNIPPRTIEAHAFTYLDFAAAAQAYGKVGGFAHLATLVKRLRAGRPGALLLDGGDTWQGSATSLWSKGQDMVDACKLLGVDMMTPHWELTYGAERVKEIVEKDLKGKMEFLAQNIKTTDFGDPVFQPYAMREMNGVPVAVIGQGFPYTPIANPRYMIPDWTMGIQDEEMQKVVHEARGKGAQVVVVLSHNGMDVDLKMASRVTGIDAILGGHTHDGVPAPSIVKNAGGQTLVMNSGSNGKYLSVLDFEVRSGKVQGFRYKLLPVFSNLLPADKGMAAYIDKVRAPHKAKLEEKLAVSEGLLYRRGNFNGSWDQLILDAMLTSILPGQAITFEHVMDQTAITYPYSTLTDMSGATIKDILEDVCDNLFNADPYKQQGGDMVRVGGMSYTCDPNAAMGKRIQDMRLGDKPVEANKTYKVAGWAPVAEGAKGEPIWDVVSTWLRDKKVVTPRRLNEPKLIGMGGNPGIA